MEESQCRDRNGNGYGRQRVANKGQAACFYSSTRQARVPDDVHIKEWSDFDLYGKGVRTREEVRQASRLRHR